MSLRVSLLTLGVCASLAACGSDVETVGGSGGGGGSSSSTSSATTSTGTDGSGGGGGAGGAACESPYDPACNCADCGGKCWQPCNFSPDWVCDDPGDPGEGQFSCGGVENCNANQACVNVSTLGDGCEEHFCADLPDDCATDATCACVADYIDQADYPTTCDDASGHVEVGYQAYAPRPPWDQPWCGGETCVGVESCWGCVLDGGTEASVFLCDLDDPSASGTISCSARWVP